MTPHRPSTVPAQAPAPVIQAPAAVVMIRPVGFFPNPQTSADNAFQSTGGERPALALAYAAYREVTELAETLRAHGVTVHLFDDTGSDLPDSVFPNNWFSTHADGTVVLYPMFCPNRRGERRPDIIDALRDAYRVRTVLDYSHLEADDVFLEGTGAMVLDHVAGTAFIATSRRAHDAAARQVCADLGYTPVLFSTEDGRGRPIYHTNVMLSVASTFSLAGLDLIRNPGERLLVRETLRETGHEVIELTGEQVGDFAGNAIEVEGATGRLLVISRRALESLRPDQVRRVREHATIVPVGVPTIELAGGSVRCMLAGVHLAPRSAATAEGPGSDHPAP